MSADLRPVGATPVVPEQPVRRTQPANDAQVDPHRGQRKSEPVDEHIEREARPDVEVEDVVEQLNNVMDVMNKDLRFQTHDATSRRFVQIVDIKNDEVIREWPQEEFLDVVGRLHEAIGMIIDTQG